VTETVFSIMGPTASGKTELAMQLADKFPFEIISVDSAMIYRDMNVGTAKPEKHELKKTPHHLIDIINPNESYSAAQFCCDAQSLIDEILSRGKNPLLVGGTMMYFNALQQGLSTLPQGNQELRDKLQLEANRTGWPSLHQRLIDIDPSSAQRIHPNDAQRISRALEVYELTGKSLSEHYQNQDQQTPFQFINVALFPKKREWLHQRIGHRFQQMLDSGLIEEVEGLLKKWQLTPDMPSLRSVGYRQVYDFLIGRLEKSGLREKGTAATRQLAKRQLTWLRHWDKIYFIDPQEEGYGLKIIDQFRQMMDN